MVYEILTIAYHRPKSDVPSVESSHLRVHAVATGQQYPWVPGHFCVRLTCRCGPCRRHLAALLLSRGPLRSLSTRETYQIRYRCI
ncbi:hypothetical protein NQ315_008385 [Exocentrus adspersus]|uniref:Uncharacterized protein n=1 Tax=Exocentrus adspersus TaxID=1586481 RepID=A0AAV8VS79_9CUCU|nr:hypothetical protein NQ315_008385 [Exocentrus adspersus]